MHARPSATGEAPECAAWLALGSVPALSLGDSTFIGFMGFGRDF